MIPSPPSLRTVTLVASVLAVSLTMTACKPKEGKDNGPDAGLTTDKERISYILGSEVGGNLKELKDEIDMKVVTQAMQDAIDGKEPKIAKEQQMQIMQAFAMRMQEKQKAKSKAEGDKHLADGQKFLAENGTREGVQTTASGLQYKVMTPATGRKPKVSDTVKVHYSGTLLDGTKFDSSYDRNEPASFRVDQVVPGWTEALQLMSVGSKYTLWIPSELGYGASGTPGGPIPPNATLVFVVELLEIAKP